MKKNLTIFSKIIPILFFSILVFISCKDNTVNPDDKFTISCVVVDSQNNSVPAALIEIYKTVNSEITVIDRDTTDENGYFTFANLPEDFSDLMITISHPDFKTYQDKLSNFISPKKSKVVLLSQDSCKGVLNIYSYNKKDSSALNDVEIRLFRSGQLIRKDTTSSGMVSFTNVCNGHYIMRLYKPGYSLTYDSVYVEGVDSIPVVKKYYMNLIDSCCNGIIGITVKDSANGNPLAGANIYLYSGQNQHGSIQTDNNGYAQFNYICSGTYTIKITNSNYQYKYINNLQMGCNDTNMSTQYLVKQVSQDTCCTAVLKAKVIDSKTSEVIPGATVYVFRNGGSSVSGTTDSNGLFIAHNLCAPATYTVKAMKTNYTYVYTQVSFTDCVTKDMTFSIMKQSDADSCCHGKIEVILKDSANGNALEGASVKLYLGQVEKGNSTTNSSGYFSVHNLCNGDYTLRMQKDHYNLKYVTIHLGCNDTNSSTQYLSKIPSTDTCCTAILNVTVLDSLDNTPIEGATVYVYRSGGQAITGTTNQSGKYTAHNLCAPVSYTIKAMKDGYSFQYVQLSYTICEEKNLTIKIGKK